LWPIQVSRRSGVRPEFSFGLVEVCHGHDSAAALQPTALETFLARAGVAPHMAILSFKLDQLFTLHVPLLVKFRHGSQLLVLFPHGLRFPFEMFQKDSDPDQIEIGKPGPRMKNPVNRFCQAVVGVDDTGHVDQVEFTSLFPILNCKMLGCRCGQSKGVLGQPDIGHFDGRLVVFKNRSRADSRKTKFTKNLRSWQL
jgi:hypothetical protein